MFKKLLIICLFLIVPLKLYAATENGVTVTYWHKEVNINGVVYPGAYGKDCMIFTNYTFGTQTKVYNGSGGTSTTAGFIDIRAFPDNRTVGYNLTDVDSGTTTLYLEGLIGGTTTPVSIYNAVFATTTTGSIPIPEYYNYFRVGGLSTGTNSANKANVFFTATNNE